MLQRALDFLRANLGDDWTKPLTAIFHVVLILVLAWIAIHFSRRLIRAMLTYLGRRGDGAEGGRDVKRLETLSRVFRYVASVVIVVLAGLAVLGELGVSVAPILGAAGVVGIAVGFGAQSLVKDYFNGLFLLIENQVRQGDVVELGGKSGLVEEVTLRFVRLRDYEGNVHFVPNGQISVVTSKSREFAQAVVDVGVAYREDVDEVLRVMGEVAARMREDPVFGPKTLDDLEIAGVESLADSAVVLRCRFKVVALEQWGVRRELLRRLKRAFDERGIEIPFPHVTLYAGADKKGNAVAHRVVSLPREATS